MVIFQKFGTKLLVAAISFRVLALILVGGCTAFAPDEMGYYYSYIRAFKDFSMDDGDYWSGISQFSLQAIYFPAHLFSFLGVPILWSLRLESLGAFALASIITWKSLTLSKLKIEKNVHWKFSALILIIAVTIPSNILWTSLGLRESFIFLGIVLVFASLHLINSVKKDSEKLFIALTVSLLFIGLVKIQIYFLICVSVIVAQLVFSLAEKTKTGLRILAFVFTSIVISSLLLHQNLLSLSNRSSSVVSSGVLNGETSLEATQSRTSEEIVRCNKEGNAGVLIKILFNKISIEDKSKSDDNLKTPEKMAVKSSIFLKYWEKVRMFLFFPSLSAPISISVLEGTIESFLWVPLYVWFFFLMFNAFFLSRHRVEADSLFLYVFAILFTVFSIYTEVNFGTAIRHRSILLVPIGILTLMHLRKLNSYE
jgi:hypothetical protein